MKFYREYEEQYINEGILLEVIVYIKEAILLEVISDFSKHKFMRKKCF